MPPRRSRGARCLLARAADQCLPESNKSITTVLMKHASRVFWVCSLGPLAFRGIVALCYVATELTHAPHPYWLKLLNSLGDYDWYHILECLMSVIAIGVMTIDLRNDLCAKSYIILILVPTYGAVVSLFCIYEIDVAGVGRPWLPAMLGNRTAQIRMSEPDLRTERIGNEDEESAYWLRRSGTQ
jgi:hypothetical protein